MHVIATTTVAVAVVVQDRSVINTRPSTVHEVWVVVMVLLSGLEHLPAVVSAALCHTRTRARLPLLLLVLSLVLVFLLLFLRHDVACTHVPARHNLGVAIWLIKHLIAVIIPPMPRLLLLLLLLLFKVVLLKLRV